MSNDVNNSLVLFTQSGCNYTTSKNPSTSKTRLHVTSSDGTTEIGNWIFDASPAGKKSRRGRRGPGTKANTF